MQELEKEKSGAGRQRCGVIERKRWGSTAREKGTRTRENQAGKDRKGTRRKVMNKQGERQEEDEKKSPRKYR